jgi:hypothetical protein
MAEAVSAQGQRCDGSQAWSGQSNPATDPVGLSNTNFPEASSTTYFSTPMTASLGSIVTIRGQFPLARFMSFETYAGDQMIDYLDDTYILPDPDQNNPYVSGSANGTYTAYLVFGDKPSNPAPNTVYTGPYTSSNLRYRIYHSTDPNDPAGSATTPILPDLWLNGQYLSSCPIQPIVLPADATVWGRLDNGPWIGTLPTSTSKLNATNPVPWTIQDPLSAHFFPNGANYYMGAMLSRQFLQPNTSKNLFVVRFKSPTYPKTRSGEPVWVDRQVRFWSLCTDDPYTTAVIRCIPDDAAMLDANGFAAFVISDPAARPSDAAMTKFKATWVAWGALNLPTDVLYDRSQGAWGLSTPVNYYNMLIYRQTDANPSFTQSFLNVSLLPLAQQKAAMGSYWPAGGYCSTANFESYGVGCVKHAN